MPGCIRCGGPVPVNEDGMSPVYCDRCAGQAIARAQSGMRISTGVLRDSPVTFALIAINIAVFLAMVLAGVSFTDPSTGDLIRWGGNLSPLTLGGEYWRLLSAAFVHGGIAHIAGNMLFLWFLGRMAENYFGRWSIAAIYVLTGVGGSLLSITYDPDRLSVGASGAICGIAGALIAGLLFGNLSIPEGERRFVVVRVVLFVAFTLYIGLEGNTDNMCHLGGFASGLLIGIPLATSLSRSAGTNKAIQIAALAVTAALFTAAGVELVKTRGYESRIVRASWLLENKNYDAAIKILEQNAGPQDAKAQAMLGYAYQCNEEPEKAIVAYKKALALNPKFPGLQEVLQALQGDRSSQQPASK